MSKKDNVVDTHDVIKKMKENREEGKTSMSLALYYAKEDNEAEFASLKNFANEGLKKVHEILGLDHVRIGAIPPTVFVRLKDETENKLISGSIIIDAPHDDFYNQKEQILYAAGQNTYSKLLQAFQGDHEFSYISCCLVSECNFRAFELDSPEEKAFRESGKTLHELGSFQEGVSIEAMSSEGDRAATLVNLKRGHYEDDPNAFVVSEIQNVPDEPVVVKSSASEVPDGEHAVVSKGLISNFHQGLKDAMGGKVSDGTGYFGEAPADRVLN